MLIHQAQHTIDAYYRAQGIHSEQIGHCYHRGRAVDCAVSDQLVVTMRVISGPTPPVTAEQAARLAGIPSVETWRVQVYRRNGRLHVRDLG